MVNWKIVPDPFEENRIEYTPFLQSRKFFAVDDSGSTAGAILREERAFVESLHGAYPNPANALALWGFTCDKPTQEFGSIQWTSNHGGTQPSMILKNAEAVNTIKKSDAWLLLTDGEIWDHDVHRLAALAQENDVLSAPLVFVITGSRGKTPSQTNISVGISFFASSQDTLIVFKETSTGKIFVIAAKGCFASLAGSGAAQNLESWDEMPVFENEAAFFAQCMKMEIQVVTAETRTGSGKGVSLGSEWEQQQGVAVQVDLDLLLEAGYLPDEDLFSLLAEEAFDTLAVAYKTRSRIAELRAFVQIQKVQQDAPTLEDTAGAAAILSKMEDQTISGEQRKALQEQLREAHAKNREMFQLTIDNFATSPEAQSIKKRNLLVDAALRSLASVEAASFNAEILSRKSNRARRAEVIDSVPATEMAKLDLNAPSYKGFCLVCCGEEETMSICFKEMGPENLEDNTTDFALNFPLAAGASTKNVNLISSQNICFQCAMLGPQGMSIYNERVTAIIPALQYDGSNKKYINDQLYLALTARLATGAAGVGQLFMAILHEILKTKTWAGAGIQEGQISDDEQREAIQRRETFRWILDQVVQNTRTRKDFKEGDWVKFPQALAWTATDFEKNGLSSFAITYPIAGFNTLLDLMQNTGTCPDDLVRKLKSAKTVYSIAAKYLAEYQTGRSDKQWRQKYLELVYQDFNGSLVPIDRGLTSLVTDTTLFGERLSACIGKTQATSDTNAGATMRKVQMIVFWLLFKLQGHSTAQTFFTRMRDSEPLASAVLEPTLAVPEPEHRAFLLSIFAKHEAELINAEAAMQHHDLIPFATPFGASVLRCGIDGCNTPFSAIKNLEEITVKSLDAIRLARTKHLIDVFGIRGRFENSQTGLPERPDAGRPPTSIHTNMHISIAREWAVNSREERRGIVAKEAQREAFVKRVRRRICSQGRGNLFQSNLDHDIKVMLPSFFMALMKALEMQGKSGEDISDYEHDFKENNVEYKVRWELTARH